MGVVESFRSKGIAAGLLLAAALFLTCAPRPERPNILLVVVDTMRADHLGCYGYGRPTSPAIDRLAADGTRYENAFTTAPWTLPAFASILTGTYPWEHGAVNDYLAFRDDLPTLAETLSRAGYETAAFVSHIYTSRTYGFARGFERFEDFRIDDDYRFDEGREPRAERVVREAIEWLEGRPGDRPFFLWVHLFDPHWDYDAPPPYTTMFDPDYDGPVTGTYETIERYLDHDSLLAERDLAHLEALYDGEIRYTDAWIDTLFRHLERSGEWERTAIALTADHGEEFQDHRSMGHSFTFYDEVLRVPFVIKDPFGEGGGRAEKRAVSLVDLYPTLAGWGGVTVESGIGRSLAADPADSETSDRILHAGTTREGRYGRAAVDEKWKKIWSLGRLEHYDRVEDPEEVSPLGMDARLIDTPVLSRPPWPGEYTGGWIVQWPHSIKSIHETWEYYTYEGTIETDGIFIELLPAGGMGLRRVETPGNNRSFRFTSNDQSGGGLRFRVAPPDAPVRFRLTVNGEARPDLVFIGADKFHPPAAEFGLDPAASPPGALTPPDPPTTPGHDAHGYYIGKSPDPPAPPIIDLTDEERERLRALGYLVGS